MKSLQFILRPEGKSRVTWAKLNFRKVHPSAVLRCTGVKKSWWEVKTVDGELVEHSRWKVKGQ